MMQQHGAITITDLRGRRIAAQIPVLILAKAAAIYRNRISWIERGLIEPTEDELRRLDVALDRLISAKARISAAAREAGWPEVTL